MLAKVSEDKHDVREKVSFNGLYKLFYRVERLEKRDNTTSLTAPNTTALNHSDDTLNLDQKFYEERLKRQEYLIE